MNSTTAHRRFSSVLVTGGSGFIGSNFIRFLLHGQSTGADVFKGRIFNLDALTYSGNPANLSDIASRTDNRYRFIRGDICDWKLLTEIFDEEKIDTVVHFAAESHVDRSIYGPHVFMQTNTMGTFYLLEAARKAWTDANGLMKRDVLFHHVSTDEVYGSLGGTGFFTEHSPYEPHSPYSASKASSDHLVLSYHFTYGLPTTLTNCSNNYGPYQFPEKLIPLIILNLIDGQPLPVYGDGENIRDWLHVADHNRALWTVMRRGSAGQKYIIGGDNEWRNIDLVKLLCEIFAEENGCKINSLLKFITFIKDRPGHDRRYAIDCTKLKSDLGWAGEIDFKLGLRSTIQWYMRNKEWITNIRTGEYRQWLNTNYHNR